MIAGAPAALAGSGGGGTGSVWDGWDAPSQSCLISLPELTHDLEIKELEARQQGKSTGLCTR